MGLPSKAFLKKSLEEWERKLKGRREKHTFYHTVQVNDLTEAERKKLAAKWHRLVGQAEYWVSRRRTELGEYGGEAPRIVTWAMTKISPSGVFGALGDERKVTPHYAASPRARNLTEGINLTRSFDRFHRGKGWGGLSYHFLIPDTGELILGRSTLHKGAHVLNTNYGNVGINFFCTAGDQPTKAQARTYLWLLANAHTDALPKRHRTDRDLRKADIRGHNQWPGQSTGCPGNFTPANLERIGR